MDSCIRIAGSRVLLYLKAQPGASKTAAGEIKEGRLKVRIAAPPEDGRANAESIHFFAKLLPCPRRGIVLESGEKSRLKTLSFPVEQLEKLREIIENKNERGTSAS